MLKSWKKFKKGDRSVPVHATVATTDWIADSLFHPNYPADSKVRFKRSSLGRLGGGGSNQTVSCLGTLLLMKVSIEPLEVESRVPALLDWKGRRLGRKRASPHTRHA